MTSVWMQPITGLLNKLGIDKMASELEPAVNHELSNKELVEALGKLAGDMPEDVAGQDMHVDNAPLNTPEPAPAAPKIENTIGSAYSRQVRVEDNMDNLQQTSAPLSNPSDLDTNQDPLAVMAAKIAAAIDPVLAREDKPTIKQASIICERLNKTAAPLFQQLQQWVSAHPQQATALAGAGGTAIGGGLGFFGGKMFEKEKDNKEDQAILQLGAEIGGQIAANQIMEQLSQAASVQDGAEGGNNGS